MIEQIQPFPLDRNGDNLAPYDPVDLSDALGCPMTERLDAALGRGHRYSLGVNGFAEPKVDLDVFPYAGLVRLTTPDSQIILRSDERPDLKPGAVLFQNEHALLSVEASGDVLYTYRATTNEMAPPAAEKKILPEPEKEEQPKPDVVTVVGRLGQAPRVQQTANGPIIRFPLAEKLEDDTTRWHQCYSTKKFALPIIEADYRKGERVRAHGAMQEQTQVKDGREVVKHVLYVYGMKRQGRAD